jgi:hypothetical protein
MKIELKKSELQSALLIIASYDGKTGELMSGLLKESITLGTKRKIQKIHKKLQEAFKEFLQEIEEIKKETGENKEKQDAEFKLLIEEKVKIDAEPFLLSQIEDISTTTNYDFDIIEKLAI